jgi:hypothetical protein
LPFSLELFLGLLKTEEDLEQASGGASPALNDHGRVAVDEMGASRREGELVSFLFLEAHIWDCTEAAHEPTAPLSLQALDAVHDGPS